MGNASEKIPINGERLRKIISQKGYTHREVAAMLGRGKSTVTTWISGDYIPKVTAPLLCQVLGISLEQLQEKEDKSDPLYKYIINELGEIKGKVISMETALFSAYKEIQEIKEKISPDMLTEKDKAILLLKQMTSNNGRVDERDYISKCNELGIDSHSRKYAIEKTDCKLQTMGYGKNAKRVIFATTREF